MTAWLIAAIAVGVAWGLYELHRAPDEADLPLSGVDWDLLPDWCQQTANKRWEK